MTEFAQPNSESPQIAGSQIYRITQTSTPGGGDIWESKVGAFAFCVGPLSDYATYQLVYRDLQNPDTGLAIATFSQLRPFVGELVTRNDPEGIYPLSNRPGRLLVSALDIFNLSPPPAFTINDVQWFEQPVVDILQYLRAPSAEIPTSRPDKHLRYQNIQAPTVLGGIFYLQIPAYGRRYASVLVANRSGQSVDADLTGMTFTYKTDDTSPIFVPIGSGVTIANGNTDKLVWDSRADGMFDYLMIALAPALVATNDISLDIILSDVI